MLFNRIRHIAIALLIALLTACPGFAADYMQSSLNSGEISPRLYGRTDLTQYKNGLKTCLNAVVLPQGGVMRRPGFEYIAETADSSQASRLIPFVFSTEQAYVLEFGDQTMRVFKDGGQVYTEDEYTKLLLHGDGRQGSTIITDNGVTGHTVTANGNVALTTDWSEFGTGSIDFPGDAGDYVSIADSDDWYMGSASKFCIDFCVRLSSIDKSIIFFEQRADADNFVRCIYNRMGSSYGELLFQIKIAGSETVSTHFKTTLWYPVIGQKYHIAVMAGWGSSGDELGLTLDGVQQITATPINISSVNWPQLSAAFNIGGNGADDIALYGQIDEFRVTKGVARWTSAFTPPTTAYPTSATGGGGSIYSISTPYSPGHLDDIKFAQSADTMYLVHPDFNVRKLTRTDHDAWTLTELTFDDADSGVADDWPPFQDINATTITLTASATSGALSLTASSDLFTTDHADAYVKLHDGFCKLGTIHSATSASATAVDDLSATAATDAWYMGSWNGSDGYPGAVTFHENRLAFAGSIEQPQTIWLSKSGDYEDFGVSDTLEADDALTYTILANQVNAIEWLESSRKLIFGTSGGQWWMDGPTSDAPLDATESPTVRRDTTDHCEDIQPAVVGNSLLFLQHPGKTIRRLGYSFEDDAYLGHNLSVFAEHMTKDYSITQMALQQYPFQILWGVREDGTLLGMTYMPEHDVLGWHRHTTGSGDDFESVAVIPGSAEDELWTIVKRTIGGSTKRYVERLHAFEFDGIENAFYVDSGLSSSESSPYTAFSGLDHLEGETVSVLADGAVADDYTVSSGAITLSTAASNVHAGLAYTTDIETLRPEPAAFSIQGNTKRITRLIGRFYETLSAQGGPDADNLDSFDFDSFGSEDKDLRIEDTYGEDATIMIRQSQPGPMTVLSLIYEME